MPDQSLETGRPFNSVAASQNDECSDGNITSQPLLKRQILGRTGLYNGGGCPDNSEMPFAKISAGNAINRTALHALSRKSISNSTRRSCPLPTTSCQCRNPAFRLEGDFGRSSRRLIRIASWKPYRSPDLAVMAR